MITVWIFTGKKMNGGVIMGICKKIISVALIFVLFFAGIPLPDFSFGEIANVYANEGTPIVDIGHDDLTKIEDLLLNEDSPFSEADAPMLSDEESIAADKTQLIEDFWDLNDAFRYRFTDDLTLPTIVPNSSTITWSSNKPALIDNNGKVTRPAYSGINAHDVVLTATITKGSSSAIADFDVSVASLPGGLAVELEPDDIDNIFNFLQFNGTAKPGEKYMSNAPLLSLNCSQEAAGSVFTKNKIQLADDLSFSTHFLFEIYSVHQDYDEGFTFTLQADSNTALGTDPFNSLGVPDISPSLSVEFDTKRDSESADYEYQGEDTEHHIAVYVNGDYQNPISVAPAAISNLEYGTREFSANQKVKIWIQYDGTAKKLEVFEMIKDSDDWYPTSPMISVGLDLDKIFKAIDGDKIQDVYAGFTGHGKKADRVHADIFNWSFKNDRFPIKEEPPFDIKNLYMDASNVSVSTETIDSEGAYSSTVTARVYDSADDPVQGIPVTLKTNLGTFDKSSLITDSSGRVNVILSSLVAGTVTVRATALGGAYGETEASLIITEEAKLNNDYNLLTADQLLNENQSLDFIRSDLALPSTGGNGSTISWSSSDENFLTSSGTVFRPDVGLGDQTLILTAHLSNGAATKDKEFVVKIKIPDADMVRLDSEWLTDLMILKDNNSWNEVTSNLSMPDIGAKGSNISWTSSNTDVIALNGIVDRPSYPAENTVVLLSATISMGNESINRTFSTIVIPEVATDSDLMWEAYNALTGDDLLSGNSALNKIVTDLSLPETGLHESSISWISDKPGVIAHNGTVIQPAFITGDSSVILTATITKGTETTQKPFAVTVKANDPNDIEAVGETSNWLTGDMIRGVNSSLDNVTGNLTLHTKGMYSTQILWESDTPEVIASDGTATCSSFSQGNKMVKLTALIKRGEYSETKVFEVTVQKLVSTDVEALSITKDWLTYEEILGDNTDANQVEKPLSLALTGPENTIINWSCTPEGIVSLDRDTMGQLTRPTFSIGDVTVTLVAIIVRGDKSLEKTFKVIVKAPPLTDEEAVALDYNRIKIGDTLGLNPSPYAITEDLSFSTQSTYGSEISYELKVPNDFFTLQSNEDGSITGLVTRPGYKDSHQLVEITVTISKGG